MISEFKAEDTKKPKKTKYYDLSELSLRAYASADYTEDGKKRKNLRFNIEEQYAQSLPYTMLLSGMVGVAVFVLVICILTKRTENLYVEHQNLAGKFSI